MEEKNEHQAVISHMQKDDALCHLVFMANGGISADVTLLVEGQVVSGSLISGKEFCQNSHDDLVRLSENKQVADLMGGFFKQMAEEDYSRQEMSQIPLNYLHLKDVSYFRGDGKHQTIEGSQLRISIEKVSGFSLGRPQR